MVVSVPRIQPFLLHTFSLSERSCTIYKRLSLPLTEKLLCSLPHFYLLLSFTFPPNYLSTYTNTPCSTYHSPSQSPQVIGACLDLMDGVLKGPYHTLTLDCLVLVLPGCGVLFQVLIVCNQLLSGFAQSFFEGRQERRVLS